MAKKYLVGIDLGGTNIHGGVVTDSGKVVSTGKEKTRAEEGPSAVVKRIVSLVKEVCKKADIGVSSLAAVGVGAPGAIDVENGVVINAPNIRWSQFHLAEAMDKALSVPVVVNNDVNVGTWGEFRAGAGKGFNDLMGIFVGTGIGGGLVLGGKLYQGAHHTAGEIGHTVIMADAPIGRRTLENLASRTATVNHLTALIMANHDSAMPDIVDGDFSKIKSKALSKAVDKKDELTIQVLEAAATYVATAIANTVTLLSLPCVVVGGGVTEALGSWWMKRVRRAFEDRVFPKELAKCEIRESTLGDDAGVVGAALLALERH
jgi:glucokinase